MHRLSSFLLSILVMIKEKKLSECFAWSFAFFYSHKIHGTSTSRISSLSNPMMCPTLDKWREEASVFHRCISPVLSRLTKDNHEESSRITLVSSKIPAGEVHRRSLDVINQCKNQNLHRFALFASPSRSIATEKRGSDRTCNVTCCFVRRLKKKSFLFFICSAVLSRKICSLYRIFNQFFLLLLGRSSSGTSVYR